jgi:hypothetical protein
VIKPATNRRGKKSEKKVVTETKRKKTLLDVLNTDSRSEAELETSCEPIIMAGTSPMFVYESAERQINQLRVLLYILAELDSVLLHFYHHLILLRQYLFSRCVSVAIQENLCSLNKKYHQMQNLVHLKRKAEVENA